MAYPLTQGDIVQVTMVTQMPSVVKILNTYHYRYISPTAVPDGRAALLNFLEDWGNVGSTQTIPHAIRAMLSDQAVIEEVWAQKIYPIRYGKVTLDVNHVGLRPEEPLPALAQFSVTKKGDLAERSSIGNNRYSGIAENLEAQGQLTGGAMLMANILVANTIRVITDDLGREWEPIVLRRLTPGVSSKVVEAKTTGIISTQRTRVSFRGI